MSATRRFNLIGLVTVLGLLVVWQAVVALGIITAIPSPLEVGEALVALVVTGELWAPLLHTLWVVLVGSTIALIIGIVLGTALGLSAIIFSWTMASVEFLRAVPVVALLPVAVLLWGPSTKSELIITVYAAVWVMTVNTAGAFARLHPRLTDVVQTFGLSTASAVRKVWLPAVTPALLVGARLSVVTASLTAIIAETLVNPKGLGWELIRAQQALRPDVLWAYAFVAGLFGYLMNILVIEVAKLLSPAGRNNPALIGA